MNKLVLLAAWVITCVLFYGVAAHASELDQATKMTFNQPVRVPGVSLPAGTYLFKLATPDQDLNLIQIFSANGTHLFATVPTIPADRLETSDKTVLTMATEKDGAPAALLTWFYPGENTGHQFVYPKAQEQQLAQDRQTVIANTGSESGD